MATYDFDSVTVLTMAGFNKSTNLLPQNVPRMFFAHSFYISSFMAATNSDYYTIECFI